MGATAEAIEKRAGPQRQARTMGRGPGRQSRSRRDHRGNHFDRHVFEASTSFVLTCFHLWHLFLTHIVSVCDQVDVFFYVTVCCRQCCQSRARFMFCTCNTVRISQISSREVMMDDDWDAQFPLSQESQNQVSSVADSPKKSTKGEENVTK